MDHFNQKANEWDTPEKVEQNKSYAEKILKHISGKKLSHVLEVGCGTGLLGSNFLQEGTSLLGVDTSKGMLAVFDQKFKDNAKVESQLINLETDELEDSLQKFDLIISSMAFHHLKDPEQMILKLKKLLAKDGLLAVIDLDQEDGSFHPDPKNMGVHHFGFSKATTKSWADKAEFAKSSHEIVRVVKKETGEYPIFLATYSK